MTWILRLHRRAKGSEILLQSHESRRAQRLREISSKGIKRYSVEISDTTSKVMNQFVVHKLDVDPGNGRLRETIFCSRCSLQGRSCSALHRSRTGVEPERSKLCGNAQDYDCAECAALTAPKARISFRNKSHRDEGLKRSRRSPVAPKEPQPLEDQKVRRALRE